MKVLIFSDLQATESAERLRANPTLPLQRWRVAQFLGRLVPLMDEHRVDAIWDLGDTLDDRSAIPVPTLQTVADMMECVAPDRAHSIKLVGNHEQHYKSTTVHSGALFRQWYRHVVDRPLTLNLDGVSVVCLPFPAPGDDLEAILTQAMNECQHETRILLGHLDVMGATYPSGGKIEKGLSQHWFGMFDLCLFGHVHKHQQLAPNAWYVGSPFQQDFTERDQPKYVAILDTTTRNLQWVEMMGFPRYRWIGVDDLDSLVLGEDRVQAILTSPEETQRFYAHPMASQVGAVYKYKEAAAVDAPDAEIGRPESYVERWTKLHPLSWMDQDELAAIGRDLLTL